MLKTKKHETVSKTLLIAMLLLGFLVAGTIQATAQEKCKKSWETTKPQRDCWINKIKKGEKQLAWAELDRANLTGLDLSKINLTWARLSGVLLNNANLTGATLIGAYLENADLTGADLTGADLGFVKEPDETDSSKEEKGQKKFRPGEQESGIKQCKTPSSNEKLRDDEWREIEECKAREREAAKREAEKSEAARDEAKLREANITGAKVSRSKTKGIDFEDWKRRGGKVVE